MIKIKMIQTQQSKNWMASIPQLTTEILIGTLHQSTVSLIIGTEGIGLFVKSLAGKQM